MNAVEESPVQFAPTASQLDVAYSVCRHITRSSARNFYYAFLVLPRPKRRALCAVYAFMRRCDDIADDAGEPVQARRAKLEAALEALHRAQQGKPTDDAVLLALVDTQRRYAIPPSLLDQLAYGTMMDLPDCGRGPSRGDFVERAADGSPEIGVHYRTFDDLAAYCYKVASVVGLVCIRIFGYHDRKAEALAERCGLAFQLTNILRDVKEDAEMGRIYLPADDLAAFGLTALDLREAKEPARLRPLLAMEAERAREYYRAGDELIAYIDQDSRAALWVLVQVYRSLLDKIEQRQFNVFAGKIRLTAGEKLVILAKGALKKLGR